MGKTNVWCREHNRDEVKHRPFSLVARGPLFSKRWFLFVAGLSLSLSAFGAGIGLTPENFPGNWSISGSAAVHSTPMGSKFVRLSAPKGESVTLGAPVMDVEGKKAVEISVKYRTSVGDSRGDYGSWIFVNILDKKGASLGIIQVACKSPLWREETRYSVLPAGAAQLGVQVRLQQSGGEFDISAMSIRDCGLRESAEEATTAFETVERWEMGREGKLVFLRAKAGMRPGIPSVAYPSRELVQKFVLPPDQTDSPELLYEIETSFTMPEDAKAQRAPAALFTMGRNMTGAAEPDSICLMLWDGGSFMARLTSDNPSMKTDLGKKIQWRKGETHTVKLRFDARSLEGWIDGEHWGTALLSNSFAWKKDRPFFLGAETETINPWLGKIDTFSLTVLRPSFRISFDGGRQGGYFTGPGPHAWGITFPKGQGEGVAVTLRVKNQRGEDVGEAIAAKAPSAERRDFVLPALPYGGYFLQVLSEKNGKSSVEKRSFVVTPPIERVPAAESSFGITTEFPLHGVRFNEAHVKKAFQRIAAAGIRWFRLWQRWDDIEDAPGHYQWANLDKVVELAQANGLVLYPCLTGGALPFQTTQPLKKETGGMMTTACYAPADLGLWKNYLKALAERYKGKIGIYQIWNEPDAKNGFYPFDPKAYVEVLKASAETLRAADPTLRIGLGGFAAALAGGGGSETHSVNSSAWSGRAFYAENPGPYFDIVDIHYYSVNEMDQSWDRNTESARGTHRFLASIGEGGKPLWNSETSMYSGKEGELGGWANVKCLSEQAQGMELIRFHVQSLAVGIQRSFWYGLFGDVGIINQDFSPKVAYAAQVNAARLLQGARFVEELPLAPNVRAYRFQVAGREVIALWTTGDTVNLGITHAGKETWTQGDAFGNEQTRGEASTLLKLTGDPIFLSSSRPLIVKPLAHLSLAPWNGTGPANAALLTIFNPAGAEVKVEYAFVSGGVESSVEEARLAPGEGNAFAIDLPSTVNPVLAEVRFSGGIDQFLSLEQSLPFRKVVKVGAQPVPISLDTAAQLKIGQETRDLQARVVSAAAWKGANDLSAKIELHSDGDKIVFQAAITDEQVVPAVADKLWNGDCLEIFLTRGVGTEGADSYQAMIAADGRVSWKSDRAWKGFEAKATKTLHGYVIDGSFPMDGKVIGFNIAVDDADDSNGRKSQLVWAPDQDGVLVLEP